MCVHRFVHRFCEKGEGGDNTYLESGEDADPFQKFLERVLGSDEFFCDTSGHFYDRANVTVRPQSEMFDNNDDRLSQVTAR